MPVTVIDRSGSVLGDSIAIPAEMDNHAGRPEVKGALAGEETCLVRHSATVDRDMMYAAAPIEADGDVGGDVIRVKNRPKSLESVKTNLAELGREVPDFLTLVDGAIPEGHVVRMPESDDVSIPVQAQLIVELCSK